MPIDGLTPIAEEITIAKEKKKREKAVGPYQAVSEDSDEQSADDDVEKAAGGPKDKKALKKEVK